MNTGGELLGLRGPSSGGVTNGAYGSFRSESLECLLVLCLGVTSDLAANEGVLLLCFPEGSEDVGTSEDELLGLAQEVAALDAEA